MSAISKQTAMDIALAYRELENAEALLKKVSEALDRHATPDLRDAFGRQRGLQLGVPSGENSHQLFDVPWKLAKPVIEAHIAHHRATIDALSVKAQSELSDPGF